MNNDRYSHQAAELVRGLVALPGGKALNIVGKRFSRFLPGEPGIGYEQREESFEVDKLPAEEPPIPQGMDELELTLQGEVADAQTADAVIMNVREMLSDASIASEWDYRTRFEQFGSSPHLYKVTLFTDATTVYPA